MACHGAKNDNLPNDLGKSLRRGRSGLTPPYRLEGRLQLFNPKTIVRHIASAGAPDPAKLEILRQWAATINDRSIETQSETEIEDLFKQQIVCSVLGYMPFNEGGAWTVASKAGIGSGAVDLALGHFTTGERRIIAPFELKGAKTKNLDAIMPGRAKTPVQQAWEYAADNVGTKWVLVSNYLEVRLYAYSEGRLSYEGFDLAKLTDPAHYQRFTLLLSAENLLGGRTLGLLDESRREDRDITARLYKDYRELRSALIGAVQAELPAGDPLDAIRLGQTILDRVLFTAFAEDNGLLPDNTLLQAFEHTLVNGLWHYPVRKLHFALGSGHLTIYHKDMTPTAVKSMASETMQATVYSIHEVVEQLNVSEATIRNWIKLGLLSGPSPTTVTIDSFESFRADYIGKSKLTGRANKSHTDYHDHNEHIERTLEILLANPASASSQYENGLSNAYRNKEGIYYTPDSICHDMLSKLPLPPFSARFCDPCCGTGNFLIAAIKAGFAPENIYGYDTDPIAVEIARHRVKELTGCDAKNIVVRNGLMSADDTSYDVIATNPPWGKKLSVSEKSELNRVLGLTKSEDTCSLFLAWAMRHVSKDGFISFLLPDSFFNIAGHEVARKRAMQFQLVCIEDFGKPFKGLMVGAVAITLRNSEPREELHLRILRPKNVEFVRRQSDFLRNPKAIINFNSTRENSSTIASVIARPHITLKGAALWGLGVVTGDNRRHCREEPITGDLPVYRGSDITCSGLKNPSVFISGDLSKYQQVASRDLYFAPEKIIYKFISSKIVCFYDTKQSLILNSANLVIPKADFPVRSDILAEYLNSDFVNWIFSEVFRTHKVLRSDLEAIPVFSGPLAEMRKFDENALLEYLNVERGEHGSFRVKG